MTDKKQNEPISDYQLGFLGVVLVTAGLAKNSDRIEAWFKYHWFSMSLLAISLIAGIIQYARFRRRQKNPDGYLRKLAMKAMRSKNSLGPIEKIFFIERKLPVVAEINVGQTLKDQNQLVLTNEQRSGHVQIVGATGRGKTQSVILPWFIQDLYNGNCPILIDGKGDNELEQKISRHMNHVGCCSDYFKFDMSNPKESCTINPLAGGTAQEVADRLIASLEFESSYFRDVQYQASLMIFELMKTALWPLTFQGLYLCLTDPQVLAKLLKDMANIPQSLKQEVMRFQSMSAKEREEKYSGLISQIRPFASGELLHLVNGCASGKQYLSIERFFAVTSADCPQAAVILLSTMRYQKSAKILGKIILQTMSWAASTRSGEESFVPVFMDEFSSFVYDGFEQFLNKSRSYRVALHLSHQSVGDFERISSSFLKTVNVNTNVKCLLGLNDPDTADYYAKHLGTRTVVKNTERGILGVFGSTERTGDVSLREAEEYRVSPNRLRNYSQGKGVLSLLVNGIPVAEEIQFEEYKLPALDEVA